MLRRRCDYVAQHPDDFNRKRFVAAVLLTRAAVETASAVWYLRSKIASAPKGSPILSVPFSVWDPLALAKLLIFMVGGTGIEPVTPAV